jgi:hypothetical protein
MKDSGFEVADDGRLIIPEEEGSLKKPEKSSGLYHPHVLLYFCFVKVNATYFFYKCARFIDTKRRHRDGKLTKGKCWIFISLRFTCLLTSVPYILYERMSPRRTKVVAIREAKFALVMLSPRTFAPGVFYRVVVWIFIPSVGLIFR